MTVRQYLPMCCVRTDPEISKKEGSYASRFYRWFLGSLEDLLCTSRGSARFN